LTEITKYSPSYNWKRHWSRKD